MNNKEKQTVAVMQPYIFPYIGYFQLIYASDVFVFYDDVNFIKQGWINRNKILGPNDPILFSVPLKKISSNKLIKDVEINIGVYQKWYKKFMKSLKQVYAKAPFFSEMFPLIQTVLEKPESHFINDLAIKSVTSITDYLQLSTNFYKSSESFEESQQLDKAERLFYINKKLGAQKYVNAIGGKELYDRNQFQQESIDLHFLKPDLSAYEQFNNDFKPGLSIIDVLMFNSKEDVVRQLSNYHLE